MNIEWPIDEKMDIGWRQQYFQTAIDIFKPNSYCEIGCHNGRWASVTCSYILSMMHEVSFEGYDLFDLANEKTHKEEINGKGTGSYDACFKRMEKLKKRAAKKKKSFVYSLHKGFTTDTLPTKAYDMVFIDGGHKYETVMEDYERVKQSKVIFFDDYDIPDTKKACDEIGATNLITWPSKKKLAVLINV